eukprot:6343437-Amphidinium_carterae.1
MQSFVKVVHKVAQAGLFCAWWQSQQCPDIGRGASCGHGDQSWGHRCYQSNAKIHGPAACISSLTPTSLTVTAYLTMG